MVKHTFYLTCKDSTELYPYKRTWWVKRQNQPVNRPVWAVNRQGDVGCWAENLLCFACEPTFELRYTGFADDNPFRNLYGQVDR